MKNNIITNKLRYTRQKRLQYCLWFFLASTVFILIRIFLPIDMSINSRHSLGGIVLVGIIAPLITGIIYLISYFRTVYDDSSSICIFGTYKNKHSVIDDVEKEYDDGEIQCSFQTRESEIFLLVTKTYLVSFETASLIGNQIFITHLHSVKRMRYSEEVYRLLKKDTERPIYRFYVSVQESNGSINEVFCVATFENAQADEVKSFFKQILN